ncbi:Arc family DNA-binding protein [Candidatus Phyllobacterium onerii]|uniref:Arc family DNA-binding protein n=1 Tax=Candidatus Phyllobacterium onerii TaxID=3020828 RepID=UPI0023310F05|nr:Arc family DNA-binding protein [Phyllobacterium sp. IY22]
MAKQDEWTRITLRIPPELHEKLTEAARTSSMNAEIIRRLEYTIEVDRQNQEIGVEYEERTPEEEEAIKRIIHASINSIAGVLKPNRRR